MATNSLSESLHTKDQVLGTFDHTFDEMLTLKDNFKQPGSYAPMNQQTGRLVQSKKEPEEDDIFSSKFDNHTSGDHDYHGNSSPEESRDVLADKNATAVSFSIEVGNTCVRQPPKRLLAKTRQHKNATPTLEALNDKQIQAEKRRKQQSEKRLQRIHDRQEAARKLAQNVDILLQQRALAMGVAGDSVKPLPSKQIMATANQVARNFRNLTNQLGNDLTINERLNTRKSKKKFPKKETKCDVEKRESASQSVSFTVDVPSEVKSKSKKPSFTPKQKKVLTVEELEEKQRRAEERRNERQVRRVKRVKENREALMKMAKDIEKFKNLQQAMDSSPAGAKQAKESALLAERIAAGFDRLGQRYQEDLKRAENFCIEQPFVV